MTSLFAIGVTNALIATLLAAAVWCFTRIWRQPPLAQLLWVFVLVKLITPPLVAIPWRVESDASAVLLSAEDPTNAAGAITVAVSSADVPAAPAPTTTQLAPSEPIATALPSEPQHETRTNPTTSVEQLDRNANTPREPLHWIPLVITAWLVGSAIWIVIAIARLTRFHLALRNTVPCPNEVCHSATEVAERLGVTSRFQLRMTDARLSPLVWPIGRPTILLSRPLLAELSREETTMLLTHELAHLRRKDHWLRWLELIVTAIYWWHPVVWWSRRMIQIAEEQSCDAWVVWAFPESAKRYATALFKAVQMASDHRPRVPQVASRLGSGGNLKERIEDIMNATWKCRLTAPARVALILAAFSVLPLSLRAVTAAGNQPEESEPQANVAREDQKGNSAPTTNERIVSPPSTGRSADDQQRLAPAPSRVRIPASPYRVAAGDVLHVAVSNAFADQPIADDYLVEPSGTIALGPAYGRATVAGLTLEDADRAVTKHLSNIIDNPVVQVTLGGWRNKVGPWAGRPDGANSNSHVVNYDLALSSDASKNIASADRRISPAELNAMREHVKFLDERFKSIDALYQTGSRGGSADSRARTAYELAAAQAALALAEGHQDQAIAFSEQAEKYAEQTLQAVSASYEAGRVSLDLLLQTAKFVSESKRNLVQVRESQRIATDQPKQAADNRTDLKRELALQSMTTDWNTSVSVWKTIVAGRKQSYERMTALADKHVVPAADLEKAKVDYEVCVAQYEHALRTLKYAQLLVDLAETEYEEGLAKNKATPNSVSEYELKKLKIKVELAKVKASEIE